MLAITTGPALADYCTGPQYAEDTRIVSRAFDGGYLAKDPAASGAVLADERFWRALEYPGQVNLARKTECAIAGTGKALTSLRFKSKQTGRTLATWRFGKLTVE